MATDDDHADGRSSRLLGTGAALVVGGSGGLGLPIARMLASAGLARRRDATVGRGGGVVGGLDRRGVGRPRLGVPARATSDEAAAEVVDDVVEEYGGLHTLVYAAGPHVPMVHLSHVAPTTMAAQLNADAAGFFNVAHPALPHLRTSAGCIVAVTTAATARFPVRDGLSAAPKGAVEALVRALAAEEGRFGVRVNSVGPGMLTDGMAGRLISSGELSDRGPRDRPRQHPAAPLRHRHRHRRGRLLPRLRPRRLHLRPEAGRRRGLRGLSGAHLVAGIAHMARNSASAFPVNRAQDASPVRGAPRGSGWAASVIT